MGDVFRAACERAGNRADLLVRKVADSVMSELVERSPVATGRFKSNWRISVGAIDTSTDASINYAANTGKLQQAVLGWDAKSAIYLTNSLPYARRLEEGWSQQAPAGMVGLTVQRWRAILGDAVSAI